ncbi:MAG: nuclear transport factor 2 family protein [Cytophagaceae bacterium]|nr:nuclear transport factor 2 family protein [Cytophagaceae bacterium]MBK9935184.1 nuclear transport factor 2 family protein [Cytophagaceae bacterium]MBL0301627.1 nuclear transport factor 2 family protein [Cytophagaceae bacterium]MBL0324452.1 nuclear transport factor 2 family protein [Cytophagaceae bacterium]
MTSVEIVKAYYQNFNDKNWQGMLDLLSEDIRHDANQGDSRVGKELFREFLAHMDRCYDETLTEMVFFAEPTDQRVAVEFVVNGTYKSSDEGLPEATGQKYVLPAGAFLDVKDGKISRVTTYYNLPLWEKMVLG